MERVRPRVTSLVFDPEPDLEHVTVLPPVVERDSSMQRWEVEGRETFKFPLTLRFAVSLQV